jgi:hypothetical protein
LQRGIFRKESSEGNFRRGIHAEGDLRGGEFSWRGIYAVGNFQRGIFGGGKVGRFTGVREPPPAPPNSFKTALRNPICFRNEK